MTPRCSKKKFIPALLLKANMTIIQVCNGKPKYLTGVIEELNRKPSDEEGNPRYEVVLRQPDGEVWKGLTQKSASFVYGISNHLGKPVQLICRGVKTVTGCYSL